MELKKKEFALGDVLSVTTGILMSRRHIDGVYDILGFMTGCGLMTHELIRANEVCSPYILKQHPQLEGLEVPTLYRDKELIFKWLEEREEEFGETIEIEILPEGAYKRKNPIEEIMNIRNAKRT